jgi:hypothetical protein
MCLEKLEIHAKLLKAWVIYSPTPTDSNSNDVAEGKKSISELAIVFPYNYIHFSITSESI